ncbi:hypothetical protein SLE2022_031010 [Rubroshorea leprosula]
MGSYRGNTNNPYLTVSPAPAYETRPMDRMCDALYRCGKTVENATRKAENFADNLWQHLRVSTSLTDAAMAKISQGTKLVIEGGHERLFQQAFQILPGEKLSHAFACYLSTTSGPVIGTLYVSTQRIAFCSDYPLSYYPSPGRLEYIYYKVVVHLDQLAAVNPSLNVLNTSEKYIHVLTVDGYEFSFIGFISYDKALKALNEALQRRPTSHNCSTRFIQL